MLVSEAAHARAERSIFVPSGNVSVLSRSRFETSGKSESALRDLVYLSWTSNCNLICASVMEPNANLGRNRAVWLPVRYCDRAWQRAIAWLSPHWTPRWFIS